MESSEMATGWMSDSSEYPPVRDWCGDGWQLEDLAGGCWAMRHSLSESHYIMVNQSESDSEAVLACIYGPEDDVEEAYITVPRSEMSAADLIASATKVMAAGYVNACDDGWEVQA